MDHNSNVSATEPRVCPSSGGPTLATPSSNTNATDTEVEQTTKNPFEKKKRKRTSKVWDDLTEVVEPDGAKKVQCIHCKEKFEPSKTGATTQYNRHLNRCRKREIYLKGQKQLTIGQCEKPDCVSVETWKWDPAKVRETFAQMILLHQLPFNFAEYEVFNMFMRVVSPHWEKISRNTSTKDCQSVYEIQKKNLKSVLKSVRRVSVTTDLWKSNQDIQYMVLTAHFVDANMNLQKRMLNFVEVPPPHTGIAVLLLIIASIFDPRFKSEVLTYAYQSYTLEETIKYEREVKDNLNALFNEYVELHKNKTSQEETMDSMVVEGNLCNSKPPLGKGQGPGFTIMSKQIRSIETIRSTKSELDIYLEDGAEPVIPESDVLKWWRENKNKYRILSEMAADILAMAADILAIPVTTVASESAFSAGGRIIDPQRSSLKPETVQFLTCGEDWVRAQLGVKKKEKVVPPFMVENDIVEYSLDN